MGDPVAAKSTFLCMYMSNHPDTLVSYVRHWGKITETVASAQMAGIDTKGMDLTYTTKSGGSTKAIRVPFTPPLAGYEDVKGRLLQMKVDAEEALGMAKNPTINSFAFPASAWKTTLLIIALLYTTYAPDPESPLYSPACLTAVLIRGALPSWGLTGIWVFLVAFHSAECVYTYSLCKRHSTPLVPTVLYLLTTLAFGFPAFMDYRKRVQAARIDSIMKGK